MTLRDLASAWDNFWFKPQAPTSVACYRVLLGLMVLLSALLMAPEWLQWFGPQGVLSPQSGSAALGGWPRLNVMASLPLTETWVWAFFWVHVAAAVSLMLGFFTRTSALVVFVTLTSMHHQNNIIFNAGDVLMRLMAFWMIFSHAGRVLSVDRLIRLWRGKDAPDAPVALAPWALRLMQLQFAAVYFDAVICKIEGSQWLDGTAVWYSMSLLEYQRFPTPLLLDHLALIKLATWGTLALEFALGVLVWFRELRYPLLAIGVIFHLGLEYSMNLPMFQWIMIATLIVFVYPQDLSRARAWAVGRLGPPRLSAYLELRHGLSARAMNVLQALDVTGRVAWLDGRANRHEALGPGAIAVVAPDGSVHHGVAGFRRLASAMPALWGLLPLLLLPGLGAIGARLFALGAGLPATPARPKHAQKAA